MAASNLPTIVSSTTILVTPSSATPAENRHLALSSIDSLKLAIYTPVILLYSPSSLAFPSAVEILQKSLREALVLYYPFAGRLVQGRDGDPEVRCDDTGAVFSEVVVDNTMNEVRGCDCGDEFVAFSGMEAAQMGGGGVYSLSEHEEIPPLVIQVTLFKCKSIALAVNWHHQVVDGVSGMNFLKSWSELALGQPISSRPDHRRHLLSPRVPPQPRDSIPGIKVSSSQPQEQESSVQSGDTKPTVALLPKNVVFTISAEEIQQLKKEGSTSDASYASGVLISAHLWKLVTKARGLDRDATTTIFMVVDARKRLKDFPVSYFGNCVFLRPADCSVADVLDMPLPQLAKVIQDSVSEVTDDYVKSVLDFAHVTGVSNLTWQRPKLATHDLQPTFWRYFPIYELDFGFGVPRYGGRNSTMSGSTGFAAVYPTPSRDGSVLISTYLFPDAADSLEAMVKL